MYSDYELVRAGARMLDDGERRRLIRKIASGSQFDPDGFRNNSGRFNSLAGPVRTFTENQRRLMIAEVERLVSDKGSRADAAVTHELTESVDAAQRRAVDALASQQEAHGMGPHHRWTIGFATCSGLDAICDKIGLIVGVACLGASDDLQRCVQGLSETNYASHFAGAETVIGPEWGFVDWRLVRGSRPMGVPMPENTAEPDDLRARSRDFRSPREVAASFAERTPRSLASIATSAAGMSLCEAVGIEPGYLDRFTYPLGEPPVRCSNLIVFGSRAGSPAFP